MSGALSARDAAHVNAALHLPEQPAYDWSGVLEDDAVCTATTPGIRSIPCQRTDEHQPGRGCHFDAGDVADRHSDDREDPR